MESGPDELELRVRPQVMRCTLESKWISMPGSKVTQAPGRHQGNNLLKTPAQLSQAVFHLGGNLTVNLSVNDTV